MLILKSRARLDEKGSRRLEKLNLGHAGEVEFDKILTPFLGDTNIYHLPNYLFHVGDEGREVQLDNLVIAADSLFIFEIKNHRFDLFMNNEGRLAFENGDVYNKLYSQLAYEHDGLRDLMYTYRFKMDIIAMTVFINPEQTIYGLQPNGEFLVRSNVKKYLKQHMVQNKFPSDEAYEYLRHQASVESVHDENLDFSLDQLRAGVLCHDCWHWVDKKSRERYCCSNCGKSYTCLEVIDMLDFELRMLNENRRVSSYDISKFSGNLFCSSTVRMNRRKKIIVASDS